MILASGQKPQVKVEERSGRDTVPTNNDEELAFQVYKKNISVKYVRDFVQAWRTEAECWEPGKRERFLFH